MYNFKKFQSFILTFIRAEKQQFSHFVLGIYESTRVDMHDTRVNT